MMVRSANILVIDNELTVCRSCQKLLDEAGYDVSIALGGCEGLERARKGDFDLAIVDLRMPDTDGMKVVESIRRDRPGMAVIIMTGYGTIASAVTAMKLGAADYVSKPFTPDEMCAVVRKALQEKEHEVGEDEVSPPVNRDAVIAVLNRAAEDKEFMARLSYLGSDALGKYDLGSEERAALVSGDVRWLRKHVGRLDDRLKVWPECRLQQERW